MENRTESYTRWDDIVFENRNKDYGAYALRKHYAESVLTGFFASMATLMLFLFLTSLSKPERVVDVIISDPFGKKEPFQPPRIDRPEPPPPARSQPVTTVQRQDLPPIVTTDPVEEIPVAASDPVVSGTGVGSDLDTDSESGTGIGIDLVVPEPVVEKTWDIAEVMPAYEGGNEAMIRFLTKNLKYPSTPRRMGIEGTVYVSFVVTGAGEVTEVKVVKGFHPDCDKEAVRVISKFPGWKGGKQNGVPVRVRMVLPIKFRLPT